MKKIFNPIKKHNLFLPLLFIFVFCLGFGVNFLVSRQVGSWVNSTKEREDPLIRFTFEVYDKIKENYWLEIGEGELCELYRTAAEKITGMPQIMHENNKKELEKLISGILKNLDQKKKKEFVVNLSDLVLANLKPFGRSRLYTQKEEVSLKNRVNNVNPEQDLYQTLEVDKNATTEEIVQKVEEKTKKLESEQSINPQAKEELAKIVYAKEVLTNPENRKLYDETGSEPTVSVKSMNSDIVYLKIKQLSPFTFEEFRKKADTVSGNPTTLILDLRGNVGGSIDVLPYFLGPFIGPNQYAYEFLHRGVNLPFKTATGWLDSLVKYKKVVVLIDGGTQSSAEVMASALKKYNVGVLVGKKTKGWGTVEKVFPVETEIDPAEKYSVFLVHSLTLREDNQPIEGLGVEPDINLENPQWEKELLNYFNYSELGTVLKKIVTAI